MRDRLIGLAIACAVITFCVVEAVLFSPKGLAP
jgi:hypothetical protein